MPIVKSQEIVERVRDVAEKKSNYGSRQVWLLAILAGAYIAIGGFFYTISISNGGTFPYGIGRFVGGLAFSVGLIAVVIAGGELFTGNTMLSLGYFEKRISLKKLAANWLRVYFGNLIGALIIAVLVFWAKIYSAGGGIVGETMMKIAENKIHLGFLQAIALGIICNILVCLAVFMALGTESAVGKIFCIIFPIVAFIACGGEHSVANMYLIPEALLLKYFAPNGVNVSTLNDLTWSAFILKNLIPVTIGNIIGGSALWLTYGKIYNKK